MLARTPNRYELALAARDAADDAWDRELVCVFGNAAAARITIAGHGEPGTPLRARFEEWRDARDELAAAEDDRGGCDEFRGLRPRPVLGHPLALGAREWGVGRG